MKKITIYILIIICFISSCSNKYNNQLTEKNNTHKETNTETRSSDFQYDEHKYTDYDYERKESIFTDFAMNAKYICNSKEYNIIKCVFIDINYEDEREVVIEYPQINFKNLNDKEKESTINKLLRNRALNEYYNIWEIKGLYINRTFEIKRADDEYISIIYDSESYVNGTAHPTYEGFGITIDLGEAEEINLFQIIEENEFKNKILNDDVKEIRIIEDILDTFKSREKLLENFYMYPIKYNDYSHTQDYYITETRLGIFISVSHSIGDYYIIEIDLK